MSGFMISAASSGSGKTVITLALMRALKNMGIKIAPAKAGPDFIDPAFHKAAIGTESINLDCWAMRPDLVKSLSQYHTKTDKMLIVEGMMGLYDGAINGCGSSAVLAQTLDLPIVFIVDCARQSHSVAALVKGFQSYMDGVHLSAILLNNIGSQRHEYMIREALKPLNIPVIGAVYKNKDLNLPSRHLGLIQASEYCELESFILNAAQIITQSVDLKTLINLSQKRSDRYFPQTLPQFAPLGHHVAVAHDDAFRFVYPHLLNGWHAKGAEISFFSPLNDEGPSLNCDAVYLSGGYPELYAERLSVAVHFKKVMKAKKNEGTRIYGECGGYMVLGESIEDSNGHHHPQLGFLPLKTSFKEAKLHLGYRTLKPKSSFLGDKWFRAHEFHYASIVSQGHAQPLFEAFDALNKPLGYVGMHNKNIAGSFMHIMDIE
ncbi:cobyrinate a,c-diamide synthase [Bartonella tamiae]|uniref:Hydrogenobyrinate a,c-diamide synthase n=1 Tax=Bartonella tamiae Th239 TaxID=1094558 RepID=J0QSV5_9HYPH|nr:cobyrinate a,c-diamide synthase [Bartonella tamiae]EJF88921.1 cobyrinic acid a,c-diamide synthase [Bartonella tamiae Th239]EJF94829.1 cobyrinic acid a,c-diamide synthase [Bartonella tamiae Th307]